MVRNKEDVRFEYTNDTLDEEDDTALVKLKKYTSENGSIEKFFVSPINENDPNDRLWLVIRSLRDGYLIKRHDILKLGRMKFKVKEFRTETEFYEGEHNEVSPHQGFEEFLDVEQSTDDETP
jgi:hypothetical protein